MPATEIDTGISRLDSGLKLLFDLFEGERLQEVEKTLSCDDASEKDLATLLPDGALEVAHLLHLAEGFRQLCKVAKESARPLLDDARRLVNERLLSILAHPIVVQRHQSILASAVEEPTPLIDSFNIIDGLSRVHVWVGTPPELSPSVRISFLDKKKRLLLDSTLDVDDLLFLAKAISETVVNVLKRAQPLAQAEQLRFSDIPKLAGHIAAIDEHLSEIKRLAPTVGIDLDSNADPEDEARDRGA